MCPGPTADNRTCSLTGPIHLAPGLPMGGAYILPPRALLTTCRNILCCQNWAWMNVTVISEWRPGRLLNIPQCTGKSHPPRNTHTPRSTHPQEKDHPPPRVSGAEAEKPRSNPLCVRTLPATSGKRKLGEKLHGERCVLGWGLVSVSAEETAE